MIEKVFKINQSQTKLVEKVIQDDNVHYIHMIFNEDEGLPEHFSNAPVYLTVVRGVLSIQLNDQVLTKYETGTLLNIPKDTKMNVGNKEKTQLELIVVKAPAPK
jgi:quercetin dioxygenase-like cupin family protein